MDRHLDTSAWPLVSACIAEQFGAPELVVLLSELDAIHARREPYLFRVDARDSRVRPAATMRRDIVEWMRDNSRVGQELNRGTAIVFDSVIVRQTLTALFWVGSPPVPIRTFRDPAGADVWLAAQAAEHRIALPTAG